MSEDRERLAVSNAILLWTALSVLAETGEPMAGRDVITRMAERLDVTPYWAEQYSSGQVRWIVAVHFGTGGAATIGWMSKREGWSITEAVLAAMEAFGTADALYAELGRRYAQIDQRGRIADDARKTADATAAAVAVHCDEHDLPRTRLAVAHVLTALSEYLSAITALEDKMSLIEPLRGAATQAEEALNGLMEAAVTAAADAEEDKTTAGTLQAKADAASKALSKGAQEILREVNRLGRVVEDARQTLERLGKELLNLAGKLSRAETVLEETEGKREKAEEERGTAAQRPRWRTPGPRKR
jgi:chromosome segregation ATPase